MAACIRRCEEHGLARASGWKRTVTESQFPWDFGRPTDVTFGSTTTNEGYWRIKTNREINELLKGKNIIGFFKKQRLNWLGHVERMAEDNIAQEINRCKPMSKRPIGKPKTRCEDDVLEDIKSINISNWEKVAQNRDSWKKVFEQARTSYRL